MVLLRSLKILREQARMGAEAEKQKGVKSPGPVVLVPEGSGREASSTPAEEFQAMEIDQEPGPNHISDESTGTSAHRTGLGHSFHFFSGSRHF